MKTVNRMRLKWFMLGVALTLQFLQIAEGRTPGWENKPSVVPAPNPPNLIGTGSPTKKNPHPWGGIGQSIQNWLDLIRGK